MVSSLTGFTNTDGHLVGRPYSPVGGSCLALL